MILIKLKYKLTRLIVFVKKYYLLIYDFFKCIIFINKKIEIKVFDNKKAILIGNGPSFNDFINKYDPTTLINYDIYVCNGFAKSEYYTLLKPQFYVLHDPLFFEIDNLKVKKREVDVLETWEAIFKKTTWPVTICTSRLTNSHISILENKFGKNTNIKWLNLIPIKFYSFSKFHFYSKGIGLIGGMTVIHLAIQFAVLNKQSSIYMVGVDHDWFKNIEYDNQNHKIYFNNKQFYNKNTIYYGEGIYENFDLADEFDCFSKSLQGFKDLKVFADLYKIQIFRSSKSFIHFFEFRELL